jgi:polar amino acid transport system substrate-binding protein
MSISVKKIPSALLALLLVSLVGAACGPQTPASAPKVRVGVDATLPPFETLDPATNNPVGFDIDLIQAIARKTGLNIELVNKDASQVIAMVGQCQLDAGISAIAISAALEQKMDFSDPYYTTSQVLVVKKGNIVITGLDTLTGMLVGTQAGTPSEIEAGKQPGVQVQVYPSFYLAIQDLITGYTDAVIADRPHALVDVNKKPNNLKIVGDAFGSVNYGIAVCKQQAALLGSLNTGLAALKADGTLDRLIQKWITSSGQ